MKQYAISLLGTVYFYSGDDPMSGFDCSGLACELMRAAGVVPFNFRDNAQNLFEKLKVMGHPCQPQLGALSFYGKSPREITHVGFCVDETTMIEAGGGGSGTTSDEVASRQNAFVRMRPTRFRKDFLFTIMPLYSSAQPPKS